MKIYPIRSSSKGNAIVVSGQSGKILTDCGISCKQLESGLSAAKINPGEIAGVLITHEHIDHIKGVGIFSRKYNVPIYANRQTWLAMRSVIGKVSEENIKVAETGSEIRIAGICAKSFPIPHDAAEPVGYCFGENGSKAAIATDMGEICETVFSEICGCETVLLEANYDQNMLDIGSYPYKLKRRIKSSSGHLCNTDAGEMAVCLAQSGTKNIILGHLSGENNYPHLAYQTVKNFLDAAGANVNLLVAARENAGFENCSFETTSV